MTLSRAERERGTIDLKTMHDNQITKLLISMQKKETKRLQYIQDNCRS